MQLAILHYHLNRGGVTQVIRNHLRALSAAATRGLAGSAGFNPSYSDAVERVAIFFGGRRESWPERLKWPGRPLDVRLVPVASLEYDGLRGVDRAAMETTAHDLRTALASLGMPPAETLLHVHNHSLGKNASLPGALTELARDGYRLLLQVHDFAEDFRPENYRHLKDSLGAETARELAERLYPQAPQVHYADLNGRDWNILKDVLPDSRRVHLLPNPVEGPGPLPDHDAARVKLEQQCNVPAEVPLVVYPVRGIRRKNVGEMLLWSAVMPTEAVFAVTLRPMNPVERGPFDRWVALARELDLACRFGTGEAASVTYADNLAASDALLTTSVAEGFGMVFLEASLCRRPLVGRDLPEITADFKRAGVRFSWLAETLTVPRDLVDVDQVCAGLAGCHLDVQGAYGRPQGAAEAMDRARQLVDRTKLDFAILTPALQADIIRRSVESGRVRDAILEANPCLGRLPNRCDDGILKELRDNASVIQERFGLRASGERLGRVYGTVRESKVGRVVTLEGGEKLLDAYLDMGGLHPVRVEQ